MTQRCMVLALVTVAMAADGMLMEPKDLAAELQAKGTKPDILYVGFSVLYHKHIPGAIFAGPAARPDGLATLKAAAEKLPRGHEVVIYCGCCPWDKCPNIKPAIAALEQMGFKHVKAMHIATNFKTDWTEHSYPVEEEK